MSQAIKLTVYVLVKLQNFVVMEAHPHSEKSKFYASALVSPTNGRTDRKRKMNHGKGSSYRHSDTAYDAFPIRPNRASADVVLGNSAQKDSLQQISPNWASLYMNQIGFVCSPTSVSKPTTGTNLADDKLSLTSTNSASAAFQTLSRKKTPMTPKTSLVIQ